MAGELILIVEDNEKNLKLVGMGSGFEILILLTHFLSLVARFPLGGSVPIFNHHRCCAGLNSLAMKP